MTNEEVAKLVKELRTFVLPFPTDKLLRAADALEYLASERDWKIAQTAPDSEEIIFAAVYARHCKGNWHFPPSPPLFWRPIPPLAFEDSKS